MTRKGQSPSGGCDCGPAHTLLFGALLFGLWLLSPLYEERAGLKLKPRNRDELEEADNRFYVTNYAEVMWPPGCTYCVI